MNASSAKLFPFKNICGNNWRLTFIFYLCKYLLCRNNTSTYIDKNKNELPDNGKKKLKMVEMGSSLFCIIRRSYTTHHEMLLTALSKDLIIWIKSCLYIRNISPNQTTINIPFKQMLFIHMMSSIYDRSSNTRNINL